MKTRGFAVSVLLLFCMAVLLSQRGLAQTVNGSFRGTVVDQSGSAIPGAHVTITNEGTGVTRATTTGASGGYVLPQISPGVYTFWSDTRDLIHWKIKASRC